MSTSKLTIEELEQKIVYLKQKKKRLCIDRKILHLDTGDIKEKTAGIEEQKVASKINRLNATLRWLKNKDAVEKGVVATLREQAKIAKYRQHCSIPKT